MGKVKVAVYGLSTEGYSLACQMAIKGADVSLIDESTPSAISLKAEVAKTYPNVSALKDDEPLLALEPIDIAISKSRYLFFTPQIRKTGQDTKVEIQSKFKTATQSMKKNSSMIYNIPVGFDGNSEIITLLEYMTGFEVGKSINYFYYPVSETAAPKVIGSFAGRPDETLSMLLSTGKREKKFVNLSSSEHFHAIDVLRQSASMCSVLEVCKFVGADMIKDDLAVDEFSNVFLDDMVNGMYDIRSLGSSFDGANTLTYLINGSLRSIDGYIKRLVDEVRTTLKRNELKAARTKIALAWTLDQHEMRGDKIEMLHALMERLRDYIADVEAYEDPSLDIFHSEKTTVIVSCSKKDYDEMIKNNKDSRLVIVKANPLCETVIASPARRKVPEEAA